MRNISNKGEMIKVLKRNGIRRVNDKKLEQCKTYDIIKAYYELAENIEN
jgi:hypothetical protein